MRKAFFHIQSNSRSTFKLLKLKMLLKMFNFRKLLPERKSKGTVLPLFFFPSMKLLLWGKKTNKTICSFFFSQKKKCAYAERLIQCGFQLKCTQQFSACIIYPSNLLHDVEVSLSENKQLKDSSSQSRGVLKRALVWKEKSNWLETCELCFRDVCGSQESAHSSSCEIRHLALTALQPHSFTSLFIFTHLFLPLDLCHSFTIFSSLH